MMPDENPWRYRCPKCQSVRLRRRIDQRRAKEVTEDRRFATSNWTQNVFYCASCNTALEQVHDAKRGLDVYPGAVKKASIPRWRAGRREA